MPDSQNLAILGLSKKELLVFLELKKAPGTPLSLSRTTRVSRTAVYAILQNLKKRGLAYSHTRDGHKTWHRAEERDLEETISRTKRALLDTPLGQVEVSGVRDASVVAHRGKEAIKTLLTRMMQDHHGERLLGFQGNVATIGWEQIFTRAETDAINESIKKHEIIVEAILPAGWFEEQQKTLGSNWAEHFVGRMTRASLINPEYFKHPGQLFAFPNTLYFFALNDALVVEIRNEAIQALVLQFFRFMQEHARTVDANALLRKLSGKE